MPPKKEIIPTVLHCPSCSTQLSFKIAFTAAAPEEGEIEDDIASEYWEKLAQMKADYDAPMQRIIGRIDAALSKRGRGNEELLIIHKKLVCMYAMLHNTPEKNTNPANIRMDILHAAEKQIKTWVVQLENSQSPAEAATAVTPSSMPSK